MPAVLPARFRDVTERRGEGARVVDAVDGQRPVRLFIVTAGRPTAIDVGVTLERANRFALGVAGLVLAGEAAQVEGGIAVVYERPSGLTLGELRARGMPREQALGILRDVARTLTTLHGQGVAHGHVTDESVVVMGERGSLLGYGVADLAHAVGGPALVRDALPEPYRAPEQQGAAPAKHETWSDVFAFGVLVEEVLGPAPQIARLLESAPSARPTDLAAWIGELTEAMESPMVTAPVDDARPADAPSAEPPREPLGPVPEQRAPGSPAPTTQHEPSRTWLVAVPLVIVGAALIGAVGFLFWLGLGKARTPASPAPKPTFAAAPNVFDGGGGDATADASDASALGDAGTDSGASTATDAGVGSRRPIALVPNGGSASDADRRAAIPITREAPVWGPAGALVTMVVFGDLECPHTRAAYATLVRLKQAFGNELRLVWVDRPIPGHPHAEDAAHWVQALQATSGSAATWRLLGAALSAESTPDASALERWTLQIGADPRAVRRRVALVSATASAERALAGRYDVRRTPTIYLDGLRVEGVVDAARLALLVRHELGAGASLVAAGTPRSDVYARRVAKNLIGLGPDVPERACVPVSSSPVRGAATPLVTLVEFCDYESDGCRRLEPTLQALLRLHPTDVRLVWKGLSLDEHSGDVGAERLALAARSSRGDAGFWAMHDRLLAARAPLDSAALSKIAADSGLDSARALGAPSGGAARGPGANDVLADRLGVNGVPTCFVNGRPIACSGPGAEFARAVEAELAGARVLLSSGIDRSQLDSLWCGTP